jgi:hypothetical protein
VSARASATDSTGGGGVRDVTHIIARQGWAYCGSTIGRNGAFLILLLPRWSGCVWALVPWGVELLAF